MSRDQISTLIKDPNPIITKHQKKIMSDVLLFMELHALHDSTELPKEELVAIMQKTPIID
jgi:hypothetical protein